MHPVTIPSIELGKTTVLIMCHFPLPRASAPSLYESGTVFKLSWVVLITVGRVMITSVRAPEMRLVSSEKNWQKMSIPTKP